jgi:hypothetical protein
MIHDGFQGGAAAARGFRNPANVLLFQRPRAARGLPLALHLENLGLGLLIAATAAALPLVMMLHQ